ncbi:DUF177 domain-containing protein [Anaerotignum lactatifermentans]|uniref:DUF177 domain-containing protein n=1 Tax=Anaerotignum lactatifermentans TaxID=160404 RepID=A0ABS2G9L0_9FIRM|nr:DUF177 domain-containing protein [Anaerotignum lactatifermentans]MBM6829339.1 DUF177 domain-containing protein [Anaerotignum lactatifermentans]MBM6877420.1 DUF177 domain-containing protein [Anaerotignum lactatifermentans]MBM6950916.1 DUF177 domain-containing protein [Anaerotignum lactatifermentans]
MILEMSQLYGKNGASMEVRMVEQIEDLSSYPDVVGFMEPVKIEGTLKNEEEIFVLEAKGETKVSRLCDRCLAPVTLEVYFNIEERFSHTGRDNEETETFSGDQIDLADYVKRGILEVLPMKVICREDCKGLCPVCGKDLNEGDCGCDTTEIDPRFESLRALFNVDEEV